MKYSKTVRPSRKLAVIGFSIISPDGFAINPRIPESWRICNREPRAPESAIMNTGLNGSICENTKSESFSVVCVQMSMILLVFNFRDLTFRFLNILFLINRAGQVIDADGDASIGRRLKPEFFHAIQEMDGRILFESFITIGDHRPDAFFI